MALLSTQSGVSSSTAPVTVTQYTLTSSDTFAYTQGAKQSLSLLNGTASPVTVTLTSNAPQSLFVAGYGTISTSAGKSVTVPANGRVHVPLDSISAYLVGGTGVVTMTNGTGLTAALTS
jgi:hypothetical protein